MTMRHGLCLAAAFGAAIVVGLPGSAQDKKAEKRTVVAKILKVEFAVQDVEPANLVVTVTGQVNTGGYTKPRLSRVVYIQAPEDGIQDYFLTAVPPDGIVPQVISEVKASDTWKAYTKEAPWLKGVRIHGVGEGVVVKMIGGK